MVLRKPSIRRVVALALYVAALVAVAEGSGVALAQETSPTVEQARLQLWPEYDDPGLLVIFSGNMPSSVSLPFEFAMPLPDGARGIQATISDPTQGLLTQPWTQSDGALVYELPQAAFHIEYYLDRPPSGDQRQLTFTFIAPYAISALDISIQQPSRASDFTVIPAPDGSVVGSDGFTYYQISKQGVAAGEQIDIKLSYSKTDQNVSALPALDTGAQTTTSTLTTQGTPSAAKAAIWLPWLLIGVGAAVLVGLLAYWLMPSLRVRRDSKAGTRHEHAPVADERSNAPKTSLPSSITKTSTGGAAFCSTCGHRFGPEDRFCAQCGAARRT